jgi:hypothetical protein
MYNEHLTYGIQETNSGFIPHIFESEYIDTIYKPISVNEHLQYILLLKQLVQQLKEKMNETNR